MVAHPLKQPTRKSRPAPRAEARERRPSRRAAASFPIWSCAGRGLPGRRVATAPVSSYLAISPLP